MLAGLTALVQYVLQNFVGELGVSICGLSIIFTAIWCKMRGHGFAPVISVVILCAIVLGAAGIVQGIAGLVGGG